MPLDRHAGRLIKLLAASRQDQAPGGAPAGRRESLRMLASVGEADKEPMDSVEDRAIPGGAGPINVRLYRPVASGPELSPGIVFFHGGGWVAGDLETHDGFCRRLAAGCGFPLVAVDYRLAPEHPFPAALEDGLAALSWATEHARELGLDPDRLAVCGDSTGGGLAAAICQHLQSGEAPRPALQVLICPILDVAAETPSRRAFAEGYFVDATVFEGDVAAYCSSGVDRRDPGVSPLHIADLSGLPPASTLR